MPTTLPVRARVERRGYPAFWIVALLLAIASAQALAISDHIARLAPALEEVAGP